MSSPAKPQPESATHLTLFLDALNRWTDGEVDAKRQRALLKDRR